MNRLRIVIGGFLGLWPAGGVTWDYVQYPVGFADLGHDVYYVEDTGLWPVYQAGETGADCRETVARLAGVMRDFGLADRWAYRDAATGQWFGKSESAVAALCRDTDVFVNVSCSTPLRETYRSIPTRILIDSDPMFTQIQYLSKQGFTQGATGLRSLLDGHTHHFTFGENAGATDCRIPRCDIDWRPTRQPVCLQFWNATPLPGDSSPGFSTVMNWSCGSNLEFEGEFWGQKDVEFAKVRSLPSAVPGLKLSIALRVEEGGAVTVSELERDGWLIVNPGDCCADWKSYRSFLEKSRGEFSVAKQTYVKGRTGWFSCRSACYLASGRPVVAQDTGWSRFLPSGCGLLGFDDLPTAAAALERVASEPLRHARAAREIAVEYFDSRRVLSRLLAEAGAG